MDTKPLVLFAGGEKPARRRPKLVVRSRKQKRPWIRCRHCGTRLAQMDIINGRPGLPVGRAGSSGNLTLVCPKCGTERVFYAR